MSVQLEVPTIGPRTLGKLSNVVEASVPHVVTLLNWTTMFELSMAGLVVKKGNQEWHVLQ